MLGYNLFYLLLILPSLPVGGASGMICLWKDWIMFWFFIWTWWWGYPLLPVVALADCRAAETIYFYRFLAFYIDILETILEEPPSIWELLTPIN